MIFTKEKIEQIMEIVDFQHLHFSIYNVGTKFLTEKDRKLLLKFGIDIKKIKLPNYTPSKKAFLFGRLVASLKDQTKKIDYNDFLQYLRRGQYIPLNKAEENILDLLENKLSSSLDKQRDRVKDDIKTLFNQRNEKWEIEQSFKDLVKKEIKTSVIENRSKQELVLELGHKTENWERDLGRIAETELQDIYQYGKLAAFSEKSGNLENLLVFKNVYPGACQHCIRLYLTAGVGSEPILYNVSTLIGNGTNIGRKTKDWKAVIGTTHPFCFDDQTEVLTNKGWKYFKDLDKTERFLSVNLETGEGEWSKAINWVSESYKGKMVLRENKSFSLCTTPNHFHVIKANYDKAKYKLRREGDIPSWSSFLTFLPKWTGIQKDSINIGSLSYKTEDFCEFLGYYLSEGSCSNYKGTYRITITQIKDSRYKMFECCQRLFGNKCSLQKEAIEIYIDKTKRDLWNYCKSFGHSFEKFVPEEIKELSREYLEIFFEAYFLGDGTYFKGSVWDGYQCNGYRTISSSSYRMIGDLSEIILKLGKRPSFYNFGKGVYIEKGGKTYNCNYDQWEVRELQARPSHNQGLRTELIDYDGVIYDVELEKNNTLFVKRNNKVSVSGNCRCELNEYQPGDEWNLEKQVFTIPKSIQETSRKLKGEITITVGDKIFKV